MSLVCTQWSATTEVKNTGYVGRKKRSFPATRGRNYKSLREDKDFKLDDKGDMGIRHEHSQDLPGR